MTSWTMRKLDGELLTVIIESIKAKYFADQMLNPDNQKLPANILKAEKEVSKKLLTKKLENKLNNSAIGVFHYQELQKELQNQLDEQEKQKLKKIGDVVKKYTTLPCEITDKFVDIDPITKEPKVTSDVPFQ